MSAGPDDQVGLVQPHEQRVVESEDNVTSKFLAALDRLYVGPGVAYCPVRGCRGQNYPIVPDFNGRPHCYACGYRPGDP